MEKQIGNTIFIRKSNYFSLDDEDFEYSLKNLFMNFNKVYILCKFNNDVNYIDICKSNDDIIKYKNDFILYETDINIILNPRYFNDCIVINKNQIDIFNHFKYNLTDNIIIIPFFTISFLDISKHIDIISNSRNSLKELYNELVIRSNFNFNKYIDRKYLINLNCSEYWEKNRNCNINSNSEFIKRMFKYEKKNYNDISSSEFSKIKTFVDYNDTNNTEINTNKSKYYLNYEKSEFDHEDIVNILKTHNFRDNEKIILLSKLLTSRKYHIHVLKSEYIIDMLKEYMVNNEKLFSFFITTYKYAWITLYQDEIHKKKFMSDNENYIFTIEEAARLPQFPIMSKGNYFNPYIPNLINSNIIKFKHSFKDATPDIVSLEEFRDNLNIFVTGNKNFNIFDNFEFNKNKMVLTGSVMAACLQKNNPLRELFDSNYRYYSEYYSNSDIDCMVLVKTNQELNKVALTLFENIKNNIKLYLDSDNCYIEKNLVIYCIITNDFVKKILKEYNVESKFENDYKSEKVVELLEPYIRKEYDETINNFISSINGLEEYKIFNLKNIKIIYKDINEKDIEIKTSLKINISSKLLSRHLEVFKVDGDNYMQRISSFHLACVRAYYDGNNVYMTPSCVISHKTLTCVDYSYFTGKTTPMDIINKYRMRGFNFILNKNELKCLFEYSCINEFWRNLYGIDINNMKFSYGKFMNLNIKSDFFKPREKNMAFFIDDNNDYVEFDYKKIKDKLNYYLVFKNKNKILKLHDYPGSSQIKYINPCLDNGNVRNACNIFHNSINNILSSDGYIDKSKEDEAASPISTSGSTEVIHFAQVTPTLN